jgi:hypothetical protein
LGCFQAHYVEVAQSVLATAAGDDPQITAAAETSVVMNDAPPQFSTPGSPNVAAAPIASTFQTDSVAVKVRLPATWALRDPRGVAWLTAATW